MTIVVFEAITDTWNISIYIQMVKNATAPHLRDGGVGGGGVCVFELLISEMTGSVLAYPV